MNKLILIGNGVHSKVIQDIVKHNKNIALYAILDDWIEEQYKDNNIIYANTSYLKNIDVKNYLYCIAIGDNNVRKEMYLKLNLPSKNYFSLIHPTAVISDSVNIGYGTVVMPNVVINANTVIGNCCIINTGSIVEHDNHISDYVHISPNATLTGSVTVGKGTHIGASTTIVPGKKIGSWSTIGAGSIVIYDIPDNCTAVGSPAKPIKFHKS